MTPQFRFTIFNQQFATAGTVVKQPAGWKDITIELERNIYHSLTERIVADSLIWYSDARDLLRTIEDSEGPDAQVTLLTEITFDGVTYEIFASGALDLSTIQDMPSPDGREYKCTVTINATSLWLTFMNSVTKSVDLQSTTDLFGNLRVVIPPTSVTLTAQKVRQRFSGKSGRPDPYSTSLVTYDISAGAYGGLDIFSILTLDEIEKRVSITNGSPVSSGEVDAIFELKYAGDYAWNISIFVWGQAATYQVDPDVNLYFQRNNGTPVAFTRTDFGTDFVDGFTQFTYNTTVTHLAGEKIRIFLKNTNGFSLTKTIHIPSDNTAGAGATPLQSSMTIVADTTFPDTTCDGFKIHEAFNSITDRILGRDKTFYSEYLGNPSTQQMAYGAFGCGSPYSVFLGKHVRGYPLNQKPFAKSFTDLWGIEATLNLGLGLAVLPGPIDIQFIQETTFPVFDFSTVWLQDSSGDEAWSSDGDNHVVVTLVLDEITNVMRQTFDKKPAGETYTINTNWYAGAGQIITLVVKLKLAGTVVQTPINGNYTLSNFLTPTNINVSFTAASDFDEVCITAYCFDLAGDPDMELHCILFEIIEAAVNLEVIRCEPKRFFYNTTPSLNISNAILLRTYANDAIYKSLQIGNSKGAVQSASGIDDPQMSLTYNTANKITGNDLKIMSSLVSASLAIEQTRRQQSLELGKDWQLDDDILLVALNRSTLDKPELDENFLSITDLLNSDTRYNTRLSIGNTVQRFKDFLNGSIQWFTGAQFAYQFGSGTGNFAMTSELNHSDCEYQGFIVYEAMNVAGTSNFLFKPMAYNYAACPLTWAQYKTIRTHPEQAIGISRGTSGHKICHIKKLSYKVFHGTATIDLLLGENDPIV